MHHSSTTTVIENRAPTCESIRLADEMRQKLLEQILDHGVIKDNIVSAEWVIVKNALDEKALVRFELNGRKKLLTFDISDIRFRDGVEVMKTIRDGIAKVIAEDIVMGIIPPLNAAGIRPRGGGR